MLLSTEFLIYVFCIRGVIRDRQTSKMELFPEVVHGLRPLTIFVKRSILDL